MTMVVTNAVHNEAHGLGPQASSSWQTTLPAQGN